MRVLCRKLLFAVSLLSGLGVACSSQASTVGFTLIISGNNNTPILSLTNDSNTALIDRFTFTIGDTTKNFDTIGGNFAVLPLTVTSFDPDSTDDGTGPDVLELNFAGFDPTEQASWLVDVDRDSANSTEDYETVFFNNGLLPNSVATAFFSDGSVVALTLPDSPASNTSHSFSASQNVSTVPLPAALPLLGTGLAMMGLIGWRGRRKHGA